MVENWHHNEVIFQDEACQHKYAITNISVCENEVQGKG